MTPTCFDLTYNKIISCIGERFFLSEAYVNAFLHNDIPDPRYLSGIYKALMKTSSSLISGEIQLTISIRMLAGDGALD